MSLRAFCRFKWIFIGMDGFGYRRSAICSGVTELAGRFDNRDEASLLREENEAGVLSERRPAAMG